MGRKRYTEEQIAFAIRQHESGTAVAEIVRKMGISEQTFYRWKKKFAGMGVAEVRRLKSLEEENKKLKQLVADLALDKKIFRTLCRERFEARASSADRQAASSRLRGERASGVPCDQRSAFFTSLPELPRPAGRTENPIARLGGQSSPLWLPPASRPAEA